MELKISMSDIALVLPLALVARPLTARPSLIHPADRQ